MRGADKLLMPVGGEPCLRVMARRALQVTDSVIVTLPPKNAARTEAVASLAVHQQTIDDPSEGMAASLRAGAAAAPDDTSALMVLPADMPNILGADIALLWAMFQRAAPGILQAATASGAPGHPVLFAAHVLPAFQTLKGDKGAQSIIRANAKSHLLLPLEDDRAIRDLDTPEDWAQWSAEKP